MLEWELRCGREECARMHWPVSEWTCGNGECVYEPGCLSSSLEMLYPPPYFTVILGENLCWPLPWHPITASSAVCMCVVMCVVVIDILCTYMYSL